ncbi:MAG: M23 family metallopeptidase, partial [Candidatus Latescibacteria bacterium]|nr:M23 family metallopeptidase [Candidatus Latescibacterota bacterium]
LHVKVVSDDGATTKDYAVSRMRLLGLKIGGGLLGLWVVFGGYGCLQAYRYDTALESLRAERNELSRQASRVGELREELAHIWIINERLRMILGERSPHRSDNPQVRRQLPWGLPLANWRGSLNNLEQPSNMDGVIFEATRGDLVLATAAGYVNEVRWSPDLGTVIEINHGTGVDSRYALTIAPLVDEGSWVSGGQPIAVVNKATERTPRLYYEITVDGEAAAVPPLIVP